LKDHRERLLSLQGRGQERKVFEFEARERGNILEDERRTRHVSPRSPRLIRDGGGACVNGIPCGTGYRRKIVNHFCRRNIPDFFVRAIPEIGNELQKLEIIDVRLLPLR